MKKMSIALLMAFCISLLFISLVSAAAKSTVITTEACGKTYIVVGGDNLTKIANKCGTTVEDILYKNPSISNSDSLYIGQEIILRLISPTATPHKW